MIAAESGQEAAVKALLDGGADVHALRSLDAGGGNALSAALREGDVRCEAVLRAAGAREPFSDPPTGANPNAMPPWNTCWRCDYDACCACSAVGGGKAHPQHALIPNYAATGRECDVCGASPA